MVLLQAEVKADQKGMPETLPKLSLIEKGMLLRGAMDPDYFREHARPMLYERCDGDAETVHDLTLHTLHTYRHFAVLIAPFFTPPKNLTIKVNGEDVIPFGTAAGMDKNGEALAIFGRIYGFQKSGTIILNGRYGNPKIRVAGIEESLDAVNAQGFPSKGLYKFIERISEYRKDGGKAVIYANICGLPLSEDNAIETAMKEMEILITTLSPYVNGFVWNPASPNTAALQLLRNPEVFYNTAQLMAQLAGDKLRLVKIWPYEPEERKAMLQLVGKFIDGGGHLPISRTGVVTTNTKMFSKEQLPEHIREKWGHTSFGRSGAFLRDYRLRSIRDMRTAFPDIVIAAAGGIGVGLGADIHEYAAKDAYDTILAGATLLESLTSSVYFGPGLTKEMMQGVSKILDRKGITLAELQAFINSCASRGTLESLVRREGSIFSA